MLLSILLGQKIWREKIKGVILHSLSGTEVPQLRLLFGAPRRKRPGLDRPGGLEKKLPENLAEWKTIRNFATFFAAAPWGGRQGG